MKNVVHGSCRYPDQGLKSPGAMASSSLHVYYNNLGDYSMLLTQKMGVIPPGMHGMITLPEK